MTRAAHYAQILGVDPELLGRSSRRLRLAAWKKRTETALIFMSGVAIGAMLVNLTILFG